MKKKLLGIALSFFGVGAVLTGSVAPVCVHAQEIQENLENYGMLGWNAVQIVDSSGTELTGIAAEITVKFSDGRIVKSTSETVNYNDYIMQRFPDDYYQYIIVGRPMPVNVLVFDIYDEAAEYTIHFKKVPPVYELPGDIVFSCDTEQDNNVLISAENCTVEKGYYGIDKVCLKRAGENVADTAWMEEPYYIYGEKNYSIYYVGRDGNRYKGWHYMASNEGEKNPYWAYFDKETGWMYGGWNYMDEEEGEKTPHWSYFGEDGKMRTGWQQMGQGTSNPDKNNAKHWSYFGSNGWLRTGWQQMGEGTSNPDKNNAKHWSYFGSNGWLRTGWQQMGEGTSNPDKNNAKHWSYFGSNGWLRTGWQQMGEGTSNPDKNNEKHWSYFGDNGWLRTGWKEMGKGTSNPDKNNPKHWSYFGPNGWLRTYWQEMGKGTSNPDGNNPKHKSYFGSNGWLRTGRQTIDGKVYVFSDTGWLK